MSYNLTELENLFLILQLKKILNTVKKDSKDITLKMIAYESVISDLMCKKMGVDNCSVNCELFDECIGGNEGLC